MKLVKVIQHSVDNNAVDLEFEGDGVNLYLTATLEVRGLSMDFDGKISDVNLAARIWNGPKLLPRRKQYAPESGGGNVTPCKHCRQFFHRHARDEHDVGWCL